MPVTKSFDSGKNRAQPYPTVEELYKKAQPSYATAGGFLVEEDEEQPEESLEEKFRAAREKAAAALAESSSSADNENDDGGPFCLDCGRPFTESFLMRVFDHSVCDECKDLDEKHALITRTDAKDEFLLKDWDITSRQPPLKYMSKKNPHNPRWGDMKLYLRLQVEKRAAEVHGSLDALESIKEGREEKRVELRQKRFHKKIVELRKTVRSDMYRKKSKTHEHDFDEEQHDTKTDNYFKVCKTCDFKEVYEKL